MHAVIYARFSPRRNADRCESIETQVARCKAYCEAQNYRIAGTFVDREISGRSTENRDGLADALRQVADCEGVLVVYSLSRLARNTRDALDIGERLERNNAQLASLQECVDTNSPMGRFVFTLMSALGQLEREQIGQRTSDAMRRLQANGRRMSSRPPYGYRIDPADNRKLIPDTREQAVLLRMSVLWEEGKGYRAIARELAAEGILARSGKPFHHSTVKGILGNASP